MYNNSFMTLPSLIKNFYNPLHSRFDPFFTMASLNAYKGTDWMEHMCYRTNNTVYKFHLYNTDHFSIDLVGLYGDYKYGLCRGIDHYVKVLDGCLIFQPLGLRIGGYTQTFSSINFGENIKKGINTGVNTGVNTRIIKKGYKNTCSISGLSYTPLNCIYNDPWLENGFTKHTSMLVVTKYKL